MHKGVYKNITEMSKQPEWQLKENSGMNSDVSIIWTIMQLI